MQVPLFRISAWIIAALGGVRTTLLTTSLAGALRMAGWWAAPTMATPTMATPTMATPTMAVLTVTLL